MAFRNATRSLLISSSSAVAAAAALRLPVPPRRAILRRCSHDKAPPAGLRLPLCSPDDDSEVLKSEQRVAQTTNAFMGDATNGWHVLDRKVNSYPMIRKFIAIGTGGDDFVQAMVIAVESVLQQPIPEGWVTQKLSSKGNYVSVNIGPIQVVSSEQVQAVYNAMRKDNRMKYFF